MADKAKTYTIKTYTEREVEGEWYCTCDIGEVLADLGGGASLVQTDGIRVGPFKTRQIARQELRGDFRVLVLKATREFVRKAGGKFQKFNVAVD